MKKIVFAAISFVFLLGIGGTANATNGDNLIGIEHAPRLADFEAMRPAGGASENMLKVSGFIAREPADGAPPTQEVGITSVRPEQRQSKNLPSPWLMGLPMCRQPWRGA